jgi:hypothetical protein
MDATPIPAEAGSTKPSACSDPHDHSTARLPQRLAKFAVGNPFYLVSAALLLYGIYRGAVDPKFLETESKQVIFNFSALQFYELLLAGTAILLARRSIWPDAALLVKLEALLVIAPFILVSHAVFLGENLGKLLCLMGAVFATLRLATLKWGVPKLRLPGPYLAAGLFIVLLNAALPLVFRAGLEANSEAWHSKHLLLWIVVLPALMALPNLFPFESQSGATILERRWLPFVLYLFWMAGTGVHLVCMNYVDQVNFRKETALQLHLLAPAIWVMTWTLFFRRHDFFPAAGVRAGNAILVVPALIPVLAIGSPSGHVFLALTSLNALLYLAVYLRRGGQLLPLHLSLVSFVAAIASSPIGSGWGILSAFDRGDWIAGGIVLFVLLAGFLSRTPKFGLPAGMLLLLALLKWSEISSHGPQLAFNLALAWLLLHGLCWDDKSEPHTSTLRALAIFGWTLQSWFWIYHGTGAAGVPWTVLAVLIVYCVMRFYGGTEARILIPLAAAFSIAPIPLHSAAMGVKETPAGLVALVSSFILFGLGTAFAIWRSRGPSFRGSS